MRIVSLLPSATEFVCALGLESSLVGVSHSCDFPAGVERLPRVTDTEIPHDADSRTIDRAVRRSLEQGRPLYSVRADVLRELRPDLIVTQGLCQVCAVSGSDLEPALATLEQHAEVVSLEPHSLGDIAETAILLGEAAGRAREGRLLRDEMRRRLAAVGETACATVPEFTRVAFLEWIDPPFSPGHWNHELIELVGGQSVLSDRALASQAVPAARLVETEPQLVVAACCGMPLHDVIDDLPRLQEQTEPGWLERRRVVAADGNHFFSRPGPRIVESAEILAHSVHPDRCLLPAELQPFVSIWIPGPISSTSPFGGPDSITH